MIYEALKGLVEGLVKTYKCECGSNISEKNIDIVGAAGNTVNFDIGCPKCGKHGIIKSQLVMLDINSIGEIKHSIKSKQISDSEIVDLGKDLKNKEINVSDLFE